MYKVFGQIDQILYDLSYMIWSCTRFLLIWIDLILAAVDYSWSILLWLKSLYLSIQSDIQPRHTTLQPSVFGWGAFGGFEARQTFDLKVSFTWRVKASGLIRSDVVKAMYRFYVTWIRDTFMKRRYMLYCHTSYVCSLVTYHNLTLTLHPNRFQRSFNLPSFGAVHRSSEMTEDIGLGCSWCVFREQDDIISGNSRRFFWGREQWFHSLSSDQSVSISSGWIQKANLSSVLAANYGNLASVSKHHGMVHMEIKTIPKCPHNSGWWNLQVQ